MLLQLSFHIKGKKRDMLNVVSAIKLNYNLTKNAFYFSKMVSGKFLPGKLPPGKFPPIKFSLENSPSGNYHPENPTRNISTHVFKNFLFSLSSPLSLILLLYFCLLKYWSQSFCGVLKNYLQLACHSGKNFRYDGNVFHILIQKIFNFSKIRPHQNESSKESFEDLKKSREESFCKLKTTFL